MTALASSSLIISVPVLRAPLVARAGLQKISFRAALAVSITASEAAVAVFMAISALAVLLNVLPLIRALLVANHLVIIFRVDRQPRKRMAAQAIIVRTHASFTSGTASHANLCLGVEVFASWTRFNALVAAFRGGNLTRPAISWQRPATALFLITKFMALVFFTVLNKLRQIFVQANLRFGRIFVVFDVV